jgi:hypothetical protein
MIEHKGALQRARGATAEILPRCCRAWIVEDTRTPKSSRHRRAEAKAAPRPKTGTTTGEAGSTLPPG